MCMCMCMCMYIYKMNVLQQILKMTKLIQGNWKNVFFKPAFQTQINKKLGKLCTDVKLPKL